MPQPQGWCFIQAWGFIQAQDFTHCQSIARSLSASLSEMMTCPWPHSGDLSIITLLWSPLDFWRIICPSISLTKFTLKEKQAFLRALLATLGLSTLCLILGEAQISRVVFVPSFLLSRCHLCISSNIFWGLCSQRLPYPGQLLKNIETVEPHSHRSCPF